MNIRSRPAAALLFGIVATIGAPHAEADCSLLNGTTAGYFTFSASGGDNCYVPLQAGMNTVTVGVFAIEFQKARFSIPDPPFGTIVAENWFFPHTGDHASGVELDLESCRFGQVVLGEIEILVETEPPAPCDVFATWLVSNGSELQSCSERWLPGGSVTHNVGAPDFDVCCLGWQFCYMLPVDHLYPADGATDVPTNVVLSWEGFAWGPCHIAIGSDPDCETMQLIEIADCASSFAPNFLQPNTTYYWQYMSGYEMWCGAPVTAVHSFTTGIVLPTEETTWGRVKSLYR